MNREFDLDTACGITVFVKQLEEIKLTHSLFRFKCNFFSSLLAYHELGVLAFDSFGNNGVFDKLPCLLREKRVIIFCVF